MPQKTPNSLPEFAQQAKDFIAKAKDAGKSNTAIANTINFMFNMYQIESDKQSKLKDTEWIDKDGDGIAETLVDNQTGETVSSFGSSDADSAVFDIINGGEGQYDDLFTLGQVDATGSDINSFADSWGIADQPTSSAESADRAIQQISEIDNPAKKTIDPVTGKEVSNISLGGVNIGLPQGYFSQQQDKNKLSIGGYQLPKVNSNAI